MKNLIIEVLVLPIRLYRKFISPLKPATCRFRPTCSKYAILALKRYGILKGGWLTVTRIARCHPFCEGGLDPVPADRSRSEQDSRP